MTQDTGNHFSYSESDGLRQGELQTRRGALQTPFFMPDATRASVRGLTKDQIIDTGIYPMVINTYHLMLQPGTAFLEAAGGAHNFMNWDGPLLTDSGGFQVYSLIHKGNGLGKITEDGAKFRSVLDGSWHFLTPEKAIQNQFEIGSDMMVVLDDPRPPEAHRRVHEEAVDRTVRWGQRCIDEYARQVKTRGFTNETRPLLFCVVQGGPYLDLRQRCVQELTDLDFSRSGDLIGWDGYGFGGRHIDEDGKFMDEIMSVTADAIPTEKIRFALGIGTPRDIVECYKRGWDMFDCVIPTREGRHGRVFVMRDEELDGEFYEAINITNEKFKSDTDPLEVGCMCYACENYSKSYLRHLFKVQEPLGAQMVSVHNLHFYRRLMERLKSYTNNTTDKS